METEDRSVSVRAILQRPGFRGLVLRWNQKDLVVVFLSGLPPCLGAGNAIVGKVGEAFRKRFPFVLGADALFIKGAVVQYNGNPHLMLSPTFVARHDNPVLGS